VNGIRHQGTLRYDYSFRKASGSGCVLNKGNIVWMDQFAYIGVVTVSDRPKIVRRDPSNLKLNKGHIELRQAFEA
jgi:hypothetical protein